MNKDQKIERWAERELKRNLEHMIVPDEDGGYIAFGRYHLSAKNGGYVVSTWDREIHCFMSKRNAISWCVADHNHRITLANRILILDNKKQILAADIQSRQQLGDRSKVEDFYETVKVKLQPKIETFNMLTSELEKCINSAKYIQIRGFSNETARTSNT